MPRRTSALTMAVSPALTRGVDAGAGFWEQPPLGTSRCPPPLAEGRQGVCCSLVNCGNRAGGGRWRQSWPDFGGFLFVPPAGSQSSLRAVLARLRVGRRWVRTRGQVPESPALGAVTWGRFQEFSHDEGITGAFQPVSKAGAYSRAGSRTWQVRGLILLGQVGNPRVSYFPSSQRLG